MRAGQLTEGSPDPFGCSISAKRIVGSTSRRVIIIRAGCYSRQDASGGGIEVKVFDLFDDEGLRVVKVLSRDTREG